MTFIIGTPHTKGAGYYNAYGPGQKERDDVQTCPHCQQVLKMREWKVAPVQNFCNKCMKPTCSDAECVQDCYPYVKRAEDQIAAIEKRLGFCRAAGLEVGTLILPL